MGEKWGRNGGDEKRQGEAASALNGNGLVSTAFRDAGSCMPFAKAPPPRMASSFAKAAVDKTWRDAGGARLS
jgi:hypothetical protein